VILYLHILLSARPSIWADSFVSAAALAACCQAGQVSNHWRVQVLWRVAGTLVELMDEWRALLAGATAGRAPAETTVSSGMDIARVEGFAFSILCHRDALVRPTA
jgi:hypothetical protein